MTVAVRYYSKGGNTKKVADAIAQAVGVEAEDSGVAITDPTDLLFLGGSVYAFGLDEVTKDYIANLDPSLVKQVALFGTSAIVKNGNKKMAKLLRAKGIRVLGQDFYCRGEFQSAHKGRPNEEDLKNAADFATAVAKE